ncbi:hypothetical protein B0H13DRAFT_2687783 [Mycena leptocephala]|nr:hypothetical protein B0H13DRAFT_2687783 [Mycena leptocephala]
MIDLVNLLVWKGYVRDGVLCSRRLRAPSQTAQSPRINHWLHTRVVLPNFQEKLDDPIGPLVVTPLVQVVLFPWRRRLPIESISPSSSPPIFRLCVHLEFALSLPPIPIPPSRSQLCRSCGSLETTRIRIDRLPATGTTQPVLSCLADGGAAHSRSAFFGPLSRLPHRGVVVMRAGALDEIKIPLASLLVHGWKQRQHLPRELGEPPLSHTHGTYPDRSAPRHWHDQPVLSCLRGGCALAFCVLRSTISFAASWGGGNARGCAGRNQNPTRVPSRARVEAAPTPTSRAWRAATVTYARRRVTCGRSLPPVSLTPALVRLDGDEDVDEDEDLDAHSRISMER